jgi:hypothetical protein
MTASSKNCSLPLCRPNAPRERLAARASPLDEVVGRLLDTQCSLDPGKQQFEGGSGQCAGVVDHIRYLIVHVSAGPKT